MIENTVCIYKVLISIPITLNLGIILQQSTKVRRKFFLMEFNSDKRICYHLKIEKKRKERERGEKFY